MNNDDIGARVRSLRKKRGWTMKELAARMQISLPFLAVLERGESRWTVERVEQASIALGISPMLLVSSADVEKIAVLSDVIDQLSKLPSDKIELLLAMAQALVETGRKE